MVKMGLQFGLDGENLCPKRTNRWLFRIDGISADDSSGVGALPPAKSSRPTLKFKENSVNHLIEDVYYPAKPDWDTLKLTLYDISNGTNPVWEWLKIFYDPQSGTLNEPNYSKSNSGGSKINKFIQNNVRLELFNGCGEILERWVYEDAWPQSVDFGDLDMGSSDILYCDIVIRYARAYIE